MKRSDHDIIQRTLDGSITPAEFAAFQDRLRAEPEFAKLYGDYALLHHSLCEEFGDRAAPTQLAPVESTVGGVRWGWLAAAAIGLLLAGLAIFVKKSPPSQAVQYAAKTTFSQDAVWQVENGGPGGSLIRGATLRLTVGQARVEPSDAASAVLEGPAMLTLVSRDSLHLANGRGRFRLDPAKGALEVTTPSFAVVGLGTEFGVSTRLGGSDEVHVIEGEIKLRLNGHKESEEFTTGQAARVAGPSELERFAADGRRFPDKLSEFKTVVGGAFVREKWRVDYGNPTISADRIDGANYAAYRTLDPPAPDESAPVLLTTFEVKRSALGAFDTDGWAGLSFYSKGVEMLFFGDSFGPEKTWSLDVKQRMPVILPGNPVVGPRSVTLRYDRRTGMVSLHDGVVPLGTPFCVGTLAKDLTFDEIRVGASSNAALAVGSVEVRMGGR